MTDMTQYPGPPRRSHRNSTGRWLLVLGLVFLLAGFGTVGYFGWEYWGSNFVSQNSQRQISDNLRSSWVGADRAPLERNVAQGRPLALVRIPRFGRSYVVPAIQGIRKEDLAKGFGHFPETALPGQPGNFALAGHRVTHGEPLRDMPNLRVGDKVVVETSAATYTYALDSDPRKLVVRDDATWVLDPVPAKEFTAATPTVARLTLVTCADLFRTTQRMVVFGHLLSSTPKRS